MESGDKSSFLHQDQDDDENQNQDFVLDEEEDDDDLSERDAFLRKPSHESQITTSNTQQGTRKSRFSLDFDLLPSMPLSLSAGTPISAHPATEKTLTVYSAFAYVVGLQIGSGIFASPGPVAGNAGSVGASLIVWVASGLLAWTGAASYAELGAAIPLNGGPHAYLSSAWGPLSAYLFTWTALTALKPGSAAIIAVVFAEYLNRLFYHAVGGGTIAADTDNQEPISQSVPLWTIKLVAIICILVICLLNGLSNRLSANTQMVFLILKLAALIAVTILGIITLAKGSPTTNFQGNLFEGSSTSIGSYALALYSGLWAFDGWDTVNYTTAEMKNPKRDLPRVLHTSMITVMVAYILANVAYYAVLPASVIKSSNTVALDFGRAMIGPLGGTLFAICVAGSCFGALNGSMFSSARLVYVAGREGYIPALFGSLHEKTNTPVYALALQAGLTSIFILAGTFETLVNFVGVASWLFYLATVFGLIRLRVKEPRLERPYKVMIATPIIFCCVAVFLIAMPLFSAPLESLSAIGFILAGVPLYYMNQAASSKTSRFGRAIRSLMDRVGKLRHTNKHEVIEMEET